MSESAKAISLTHRPRPHSWLSCPRLLLRRLRLSCSRFLLHRFRLSRSRLRDSRGETLVETLASLLMIVSALVILAGGISTGAKVNKEADTKYSVVFPPPMHGENAHFTYTDSPVSVQLSVSDTAFDQLKNRLSVSDTESAVAVEPCSADGAFSTGGAFTVRVRKALALDKSGNDITWRILYVFEDVS